MIRWALFAALAGSACDSTSYYLYTAHQYEPALGCVDDLSAIDVDIGDDPGATCGAKCLTAPDDDGGVTVFASTMCGPTPVGADTSGVNPDCAPALAALARSDFCLDGGGSSNPLDASDDAPAD